ncbi:GNAT family N-acetyltransferase [Liberiplasma polymorphum]|uniref:GNAT family N-acetyltransferase n=1 Tax=Liberiplasma polymorphum TaxID=3374570 RepID=UPI00377644C4
MIINKTFKEENIPEEVEKPEDEINFKVTLFNNVIEYIDTKTHVFIAKYENEIIGSIAYGIANGDILELSNNALSDMIEIGSIYVHPKFQGLGVSKHLIKYVLNILSIKNVRTFCLDSGYEKAQSIWYHLFKEPYLVSENHWSVNKAHIIWVCDVHETLSRLNQK